MALLYKEGTHRTPRHQYGTRRRRTGGKGRGRLIALWIVCALAFLGTAGYLTFIYSNIPFIAELRAIYIETAMTTGDHQWLATAFIPSSTINRVMENKVISDPDVIGGKDHLSYSFQQQWLRDGAAPPDTGDDPDDTDTDVLGLKNLRVGDQDYAGNTVTVCDVEEGLFVSEIKGSNYRGLVMLVDDPARVFLGTTSKKGVLGTRIVKMMDEYGCIAGINASGFLDYGGEGTGGEVIGMSCSNGEYWGSYVYGYASIVLTGSNKLVAGNFSSWSSYDIRDGMQFGPVLIANGVVQVTGSAGYGWQPRTAIGQREDGAIIMLIIDGRNPMWSMGCTVGDMATIMASYGAVNAGCCDGGSSSVLAYNGAVLNKNSSANPTYGRLLPNAFLVRSKSQMS